LSRGRYSCLGLTLDLQISVARAPSKLTGPVTQKRIWVPSGDDGVLPFLVWSQHHWGCNAGNWATLTVEGKGSQFCIKKQGKISTHSFSHMSCLIGTV